MSKLVKIDDLQPGMVMDRDVKNLQGAILLKQDNAVTERHIKIFKTWGVQSVFIREALTSEDLGGKTPEEVVDEQIREFQKILDDKFSDVSDDEIMTNIKNLALNQKSEWIRRKYNL